MQADASRSALKQGDDLKPVFDKVYESGDQTFGCPATADPRRADLPTQQLVQVGDLSPQQGTQVSFVANGIRFPTSQQASVYVDWAAGLSSTGPLVRRGAQPSLPQNKPKNPARRGFTL